MAKRNIEHFANYSIQRANVKVTLDMDRFNDQFSDAQYALDSMIMTSMEPYMPMQSGDLIKRTKMASASMAGTGTVCAAAAPSGRFLYEGKTMVDVKTGSPWARRFAKKVLVSKYGGKTNAKVDLSYSKGVHPRARARWFDAAKKKDEKNWVRVVKDTAGGG